MSPTRPTSEEMVERRNDGYRALGRNLAVFSQMVATMRDLMSGRLVRPGDPPIVARLPFAQAGAMAITHAFFATCWQIYTHDDREDRAATQLCKEATAVVHKRNEVAHGDWHIGSVALTGKGPNETDVQIVDPFALKINAANRAAPLQKITRNLDQDSDNLDRLDGLLADYGRACMGAHADPSIRVWDVIRIENKVLVPGPKAIFIYRR